MPEFDVCPDCGLLNIECVCSVPDRPAPHEGKDLIREVAQAIYGAGHDCDIGNAAVQAIEIVDRHVRDLIARELEGLERFDVRFNDRNPYDSNAAETVVMEEAPHGAWVARADVLVIVSGENK